MSGIVPGLSGRQNFVYVFLGVIPRGGEKHICKILPENSGTIRREMFVYVLFCSFVFGSQSMSIVLLALNAEQAPPVQLSACQPWSY